MILMSVICACRKKQHKLLLKQFDSQRHVLKFLRVVLDPRIVTQPLGLAFAQAFQNTLEKVEYERIRYEVAPVVDLLDLPAVSWIRMVPVGDDGSDLKPVEEPYVLLCFEAKHFVALIKQKKIEDILNHFKDERRTVYVIVHRLKQYMEQEERLDLARAMKNKVSKVGFSSRQIDSYVAARLLIERSKVEFFDACSAEEASNHVCALTRAIAMRHKEAEGGMAKLISGKTKSRTKSSAAENVLVSDPFENPKMRCTMSALCALPSIQPRAAHALTKQYKSIVEIFKMIEDDSSERQQKETVVSNMLVTGQNRRRVGPKAAKQLFELLTSTNPDKLVYAAD